MSRAPVLRKFCIYSRKGDGKNSAFPGNQTSASLQNGRGRELNNHDYTIGWICALPKEAIPAILLFDERHQALKSQPNDENLYYLGRMGDHNIVIAHLPQGTYGESSAAAVVINMVRSFPSIRFCLMVGIGAGVPNGEEADIRLGDVVVSQPDWNLPGVVEYDFGTEHADGSFQRKGNLSRPPNVLLTAMGQRETHDTIEQGQLHSFITRVHDKKIKNPEQLRSPGPGQDYLFPPDYHCRSRGHTCQVCDKSLAVHRADRSDLDPGPRIHYGTIASGMKLVRDPTLRDKLRDEYSALCIEMEAAGLMNNFPCLVIRGICDYADSHKNDRWQGYAALTASAYARELLQFILPVEVRNTAPASDILESVLQRSEFPSLLDY